MFILEKKIKMGHITSKNYIDLQKRLDKSPQGAPASEALFKILEILFSEKEATLVSKLPINFFNVKRASKIWKKSEKETKKILDELADKGILLDMQNKNIKEYILAPTMAGFFEFSLMRTDGKFDQKLLSELYHQYINKEDDFLKEVLSSDPSIARTFIHEEEVEKKDESVVLDYERATKVIDNSTFITVGRCYCRHKMEHIGKACNMPQDVCLTFNNTAKSLAKHGIAKEIDKKKARKILDRCIKLGLVQIGDNVQEGVSWICNCCSCCCEALLAYKKLGHMKLSTNFSARLKKDDCIGCGICTKKCPIGAIKIKNKKAVIDEKRCIGCGVCSRFCPTKAIYMKRRKELNFVPKDSFERFILTAIDKGKLQNLIFDNYSLWTAKMLRKLLGTILKLSPAKQLLANKQLRSRFIMRVAKLKGNKTDYSHPEIK